MRFVFLFFCVLEMSHCHWCVSRWVF